MDLIFAIALSQHLGMEGNYNAIHPHVQLQHDSGFVAGAYLNSETRISPYLGWRFENGPAFLELGAVAGYSAIKVAPYARAGYEFGINYEVFAAPAFESVKGKTRFGLVVGLAYRF